MADSTKHSGKQTLYPTNSIPTAQELVGLIESFIEGKIEQKFSYLDSYETLRQHRAEEGLEILRNELVRKLTEVTDLVASDCNTKSSSANPPKTAPTTTAEDGE